MGVDLQKAGLWKRIAAWLFDGILMSILAVGVGVLLAAVLRYDSYSTALDNAYASYESQYGIVFDISQQDHAALTDQQRQAYDEAYEALIKDEAVLKSYNMVLNLTLLIITASILLSTLVLEFAVPLWLGSGQTVGKKIFSLGLMRTDSVRVNNLQLFTRAVLGKFTLETMIPLYIVVLSVSGTLGIAGTFLLLVFGMGQLILMAVSRQNALLHDLLAGTVVVDIASQRIFRDTEELIAYTKRIHAEQAARQDY